MTDEIVVSVVTVVTGSVELIVVGAFTSVESVVLWYMNRMLLAYQSH